MKIQLFKVRIDDEFCKKDQEAVNRFFGRVEVLRMEQQFLAEDRCWSVLLVYEPGQHADKSTEIETETVDSLSESEQDVYEALRTWRNEKARELQVPPYYIANNKELMRIVKTQIDVPDELLEIKGFGLKKVEAYGEEIVALLDSVATP